MTGDTGLFRVNPLSSGAVFKEGFSDIEVFTRMVKDFTGIEIKIDEIENEKAFIEPVGKVKTEFDLFAEDKDNRIVVEAQHANYNHNFERFYYYHQIATVETITSSKNYAFPKMVITLVFFTDRHSPVLGKNILVHNAEMRYFMDGEVVKEIFPRKHRLFFIFTKDPEGDSKIPEECQEWIRAIHETLSGSVYLDMFHKQEIKTLFKRIAKDNTSPELRAKMMLEYSQQEVLEETIHKDRVETAQRLINLGKGLSDEEIAIAANLPLEVIQTLRKSMG
jgi:hypothetical protein